MFKQLREDIACVKARDPAARSFFEIYFLYPGLKAIRLHRIANKFYKRKMYFMARWISQRASKKTGIEIHPAVHIGKRFFIDHGTGVVIGETAIIGDDCTIFQGVTLGGTGKDTGKRHPTLGNNVLVGAGAKVLGPFTVGDNARIASNAVVLTEVPPDATAVGVPARVVRIAGKKVDYASEVDQIHITDPVAIQLSELEAKIAELKGEIENLTVGFCGDLKYGRPVHSLINALSRYTGIKLVLISPDELKLPEYTKREVIEKHNIPYKETGDLESALPELDILYMTRVQEERFEDRAEYERLKGCYVLNAEKLKKAKPDMAILHPLPRVDEISVDVDADPRACYFKQVANGKNVRKALILKLITEAEKGMDKPFETVTLSDETDCPNARCISNSERTLPHLAVSRNDVGGLRCAYCEHALK